MNLYSLQSIPNLTPAFVISCCVQVTQGNAGKGEDRGCTNSGSSPYLFVVHVLNMLLKFEMDGKNEQYHNLPTSEALSFSPINLRVQTGHDFLS